MNVQIPDTFTDLIQRLTSRKFGIVIFCIYSACTGAIPKEAHTITMALVFGYLFCETVIDLSTSIFKKEVKENEKNPSTNSTN